MRIIEVSFRLTSDFSKSLLYVDLKRQREAGLRLTVDRDLMLRDLDRFGSWQPLVPLADMFTRYQKRDLEGFAVMNEIRNQGIAWGSAIAAEIMAIHESSSESDCTGRKYVKYIKLTGTTIEQLKAHFGSQEVDAGLRDAAAFADALDAEEYVIGHQRLGPVNSRWSFDRDKRPNALIGAEATWMCWLHEAEFLPRNRAHLRMLLERCSPNTVRREYADQIRGLMHSIAAQDAIDGLMRSLGR